MRYISKVGIPLFLINKKRYDEQFDAIISQHMNNYVQANDKVNGFKCPINFYGNIIDFFKRFNLWQNTNGWGQEGIQRIVYSGFSNSYYFQTPPLVGDFIIENNQKRYFIEIDGEYNRQNQFFKCIVSFSDTLPMVGESDYNNKYYNSINNLLKYVEDYIGDYLQGATAGVYPLETPNETVAKQNYEQKYNDVQKYKL